MEPPLNSDWLDEVERRTLSERELELLRAELQKRPAELRRLQEEQALNRALSSMRQPEVASNFTALVMAEIDREPAPRRSWFRFAFVSLHWGRIAATASVLLVCTLTWNEHRLNQRQEIAQAAAGISQSANVGGVEAFRDFDAIQALDTSATPDDVALISALKQSGL